MKTTILRSASAFALFTLSLTCCTPTPTPSSSRAILRIAFAEPVGQMPVAATRAAAYDTNSFILTVALSGGDTLYNGAYGARPDAFEVSNGTYEITALSRRFTAPEFDAPQYGDRQMVVIQGGQDTQVSLCCKLVNAAIQFTFAESFTKKYGNGYLLLQSDSGELIYGLQEKRESWFLPGNVTVLYHERDADTPLFNRVLSAGERHRLTLNASSDQAAAGFSIEVDTTSVAIAESIIVGPSYPACNGLTKESAYDVATAAQHLGDTAWVWGYIVGGDLTTSGIKFEAPFEKSSNLAIAASALEKDRSKCFSVELSRAAIRTPLNLVDHPENLGCKVYLRGLLSTYFSLPGLKSVSDYAL